MPTGISWTDEVWNVLAGCTPVSGGCMFCYAAGASLAPRLANHPSAKVRRKYDGVSRLAGDGRAVFTGRVNADLTRIGLPLRWGKPRRVFVNSMSDLYHREVSSHIIAAHYAIMAASPNHLFQVLTKRPERQRRFLDGVTVVSAVREAAADMVDDPDTYGIEDRHVAQLRAVADHGPHTWPPRNVVVGTSAEDQEAADDRGPTLAATPAALRFVSMEPLIGAIDLAKIPGNLYAIHHLAIGGESNARQPERARPMDPEWVRDILAQARPLDIMCHVKQMGTAWARENGVRPAATDPAEWPVDLRIQEDLPMPKTGLGL